MEGWLDNQIPILNVLEDTGYPPWVLIYIWEKHERAFEHHFMQPFDFYVILLYIHLYPTHRQAYRVLGVSKRYVTKVLLPNLQYIAGFLDEISWQSRLNPFNHVMELPLAFTGITDSFPIYVSQPRSSVIARSLYNPKYGGCVVKFLIAITFLGE